MRITCPLCGPRDRREFYYYGAQDYLARPASDDPAVWYHDMGFASWLLVTRNTVTHAITDVALVAKPGDVA